MSNARAGAVDLLGLTGRAVTADRLTKALLTAMADEKGLDNRVIEKAVDRATVVGILRPETIHVPAYADDERRVADIPVIEVRLKEQVTAGLRTRLAESFFRIMPRPVVLLQIPVSGPAVLHLALTHVSRTDSDRSTSVIDSAVAASVDEIPGGALRLDGLDGTDLWTLYQDLVRRATGVTRPGATAAEAVAEHDLLASLKAELDSVVRAAKRDKAPNERIKLNARAKNLRARIAALGAR